MSCFQNGLRFDWFKLLSNKSTKKNVFSSKFTDMENSRKFRLSMQGPGLYTICWNKGYGNNWKGNSIQALKSGLYEPSELMASILFVKNKTNWLALKLLVRLVCEVLQKKITLDTCFTTRTYYSTGWPWKNMKITKTSDLKLPLFEING